MWGLTQRGHGAAPPSSRQRLPQHQRGSHRGPGSCWGLWGGGGAQGSPSTTSPHWGGRWAHRGVLAAARLLPACAGGGGSTVSAAAGGMLSGFSRLGRLPIPRAQRSPLAAAGCQGRGGSGRLARGGGGPLWKHQPCGTAVWGCSPWVAWQRKAGAELWAGAGGQPPGGPLRKQPPSPPSPHLRGYLGTCGHSGGPSPGRGIHSPMDGSTRPCSPSERCQPSIPGLWGTLSQHPKPPVPMGTQGLWGHPSACFGSSARERCSTRCV